MARTALLDDLRARIRAIERRRDPPSPAAAPPASAGEPSSACAFLSDDAFGSGPEPASAALPTEAAGRKRRRIIAVRSAGGQEPLAQAPASESCDLLQAETFAQRYDRAAPAAAWGLGAPEVDRLLPGGGLDPAGLHEVKPLGHGDIPAALAFAIALAIRRSAAAPEHARARSHVLWCRTAHLSRELGHIYGPGLAMLGLSPSRLLIVEARRPADVAWAMEQGLASGALALVVGEIADLALTPARRLTLAASAHGTPVLALTSPHTAGIGPAHTRWRIAAAPSAPHPLVRELPGALRLSVTLARCRHGPAHATNLLEWCHEALRFRLAAPLADRAAAALASRRARQGRRA